MDLSPQRLLDLFKTAPDRPMSQREIMERLDAPRGGRKLVYNALMALVREGKIVKLRKRHFALPRRASSVVSVPIHISARGAGYAIGAAPDGSDLYVHQRNTADALDGDHVEVQLFSGSKGAEGRVVAVVERAHEYIVGQFRRTGRGGLVTPRNVRLNRWVELRDAPPRNELPDDAWVRVRVRRWSDHPETPLLAELEEIIGCSGERGLPVLLLLRDMGVEIDFPSEVGQEASAFEDAVTDASREGRLDLTGETIFTIDPATAKDFDDAISIERLGDGGWRLGVHIADVAHFVKPGTALDDEAHRRATSIYPIDRVVPMLPERLSNELCSLRPREDRLAMSCIMEVTAGGDVRAHQIANSVIHSRHRLNYGEVQDFFENPDKRADFPFSDITAELLEAQELARRLFKRRMDRGALDLDLPETEVVCNEAGDVVDIKRHDRFESHRLVEEFMLLANETVADHLRKAKLPCLYRIHDIPDPKSIQNVAAALRVFGVQVPKKLDPTPKAYQPILDALHGRDGAHIAQRLLLRTLMRAEYSPTNRGHFGLASKCYCHFTSPIRRYPDLVVHRVLKAEIAGETGEEDWAEGFGEDLPETARNCNDQGEEAESIEREATQIKSMEFMEDHVGDIFEGWVSGVMKRGFFVELIDMPVEGFVPVSTISDDHYDADEDRVRMIGRHTGRSFYLGSRVQVQIVRVSAIEGEMDLVLAEDSAGAAPSGGRGKKRRKKR